MNTHTDARPTFTTADVDAAAPSMPPLPHAVDDEEWDDWDEEDWDEEEDDEDWDEEEDDEDYDDYEEDVAFRHPVRMRKFGTPEMRRPRRADVPNERRRGRQGQARSERQRRRAQKGENDYLTSDSFDD